MKFQQKLIQLYEYKQIGKRMTPLRKFLFLIGLDYRDMTQKQIDHWALKKSYAQYKQRNKIKSIIKNAQKQIEEATSLFPISPSNPTKRQLQHAKNLAKIKTAKIRAVNRGGIVSHGGESKILFSKNKGLKAHTVARSGSDVILSRRRSVKGHYFYHHNTFSSLKPRYK